MKLINILSFRESVSEDRFQLVSDEIIINLVM